MTARRIRTRGVDRPAASPSGLEFWVSAASIPAKQLLIGPASSVSGDGDGGLNSQAQAPARREKGHLGD
jgi:hypothetical protein